MEGEHISLTYFLKADTRGAKIYYTLSLYSDKCKTVHNRLLSLIRITLFSRDRLARCTHDSLAVSGSGKNTFLR